MNKEQAIEALKKVMDPELAIDIWTLGLIYDIKIEKDKVTIAMTFTNPLCPYGPQLAADTKNELKKIGFKTVEIEFTFNPPWKPSEEVKMLLGLA